jgi:hypothetical protein
VVVERVEQVSDVARDWTRAEQGKSKSKVRERRRRTKSKRTAGNQGSVGQVRAATVGGSGL